jgi:hypothetical protein
MIPRDGNLEFHRRDRDINISICSNSRVIKLVHFNHRFRIIISHNATKKADIRQDYWQQEGRSRQVYEINVRRNVIGMGNEMSKRRTTFSENLTESLQRNVVVGYERDQKYLWLNINHIPLPIIFCWDNFNFRRRNPYIDISTFWNI